MKDLAGSIGIVTGASGFLGRAVVRQLPEGCRVYATYREARDFPDWAANCRADVRPVAIDLAEEQLSSAVPKADWALLLAARVATADSWADPIGEQRAIAGVTVNSVRDLQADRIVHLSSGSVYETLDGDLGPHRVLSPRLPYSIAKLTAELLFASYADAPHWVVRYFGAFGPGEPAFKLARRLAEAYAAGERSFELQGDGTNVIDPMYIDEAAARLCGLVAVPGESRAVDLTQGEHLTVREFAETAYAAAHPAPQDAPVDLRFTGVAHEQMLGRARSDPAIWRDDIEHLSVADGFARYAAHLRAR